MEKTFQQQLEDFREEVSIELHPRMGNGRCVHYQIYKPPCPDRHCWEVYRNPRDEKREVEVEMVCDTLDDAWRNMFVDFAAYEEKETGWRLYLDAIDTVCGYCRYEDESQCDECMVRKTHDMLDDER